MMKYEKKNTIILTNLSNFLNASNIIIIVYARLSEIRSSLKMINNKEVLTNVVWR